MNPHVEIFPATPGYHETSILAEAAITWDSGAEIRVSIVKSHQGPPIVRWPRRKLPDGRQVYVGRMTTKAGTDKVEKAVLAEFRALFTVGVSK